ncbi:MAG: hypothetical protein COZ08_09055 [Bacteroidetes bacterium CG_4_10_14_3_um_filter_42_6]|nr:MAG: hypothetical protein COZ08_09055 [Bacteroidetes bacterium CG_4_10_14_3_um_filter_42_6]PJB59113.1 MAG: hypothetical protein CO098_05170 [Bacteroidetes bacterium CG_4_9_14_3_um_filter_41_19]
MEKLNKDIQIDRYVTGKLDDAELWEFRQEMEKNPRLAKEVELRSSIYKSIADKQKLNLRISLKAMSAKYQVSRLTIHSWKVQAIAAGIAVFLLVGAGLLTSVFNRSNPDQLFESYYHPESSLLSVRSGSFSDNTSLNLGMLSYDQGQYEESIEIFKTIPDNVVARLYCGFAYMNVKNYEAAINEFDYVVAHGDNLFIDQASWFRGLSFLADNKISTAKSIFTNIASQDGAYHSKATDLLEELKNK